MWSISLRNAIFSATLIEYLTSHTLMSMSQVGDALGSKHDFVSSSRPYIMISLVKKEWSGRFLLTVEDYLHGLISLVNELVS